MVTKYHFMLRNLCTHKCLYILVHILSTYFTVILVVPIPYVQISILENMTLVDMTFIDYETSGDHYSGDYASGQPSYDTKRNLTIGDPLILECTVTAVRGISSSVDIIWTTGGRVVRRVDNITANVEDDSTIYTDSFEISSLSAIDNGREYQCTVVINAIQRVYNSDRITLMFAGEYIICM